MATQRVTAPSELPAEAEFLNHVQACPECKFAILSHAAQLSGPDDSGYCISGRALYSLAMTEVILDRFQEN